MDREKERLEYGIHPLQEEIERLEAIATTKFSGKQIKEHKERLAKVKAQLAQADADIKAKQTLVEEECDQAQDESDARLELFEAAQTFFKDEAGVGTDEVLKAALVDFDRSKLQSGQLRLQERMPEIVWLLRGVPPRKWKAKPWAQPVTPSRKVSRLASPRLQSFIDQLLGVPHGIEYASSEADEKPKSSGQAKSSDGWLSTEPPPSDWHQECLIGTQKQILDWLGIKDEDTLHRRCREGDKFRLIREGRTKFYLYCRLKSRFDAAKRRHDNADWPTPSVTNPIKSG
ncbi:MAG: hypothetical protein ACKV2Q_11565 [Planctomycetaceae bacterium]